MDRKAPRPESRGKKQIKKKKRMRKRKERLLLAKRFILE